MKKDDVTQNLEQETDEQFTRRAKKIVQTFPLDIINRTIESIPKQIDQSFKIKGQRTNY